MYGKTLLLVKISVKEKRGYFISSFWVSHNSQENMIIGHMRLEREMVLWPNMGDMWRDSTTK